MGGWSLDGSSYLEPWVHVGPVRDAANAPCPVLGFAAVSGTGKTTLLRKVIPLLRAAGLRTGLIKHAHHSFDTDLPGKDSYELRRAGASRVLVGSDHRWALIVENELARQPTLAGMLQDLRAEDLDLVIVEGFKSATIPRIEVYRRGLGGPPLATDDPCVIAVATDDPDFVPFDLPLLDLNRPDLVADFVLQWLGAERAQLQHTKTE